MADNRLQLAEQAKAKGLDRERTSQILKRYSEDESFKSQIDAKFWADITANWQPSLEANGKPELVAKPQSEFKPAWEKVQAFQEAIDVSPVKAIVETWKELITGIPKTAEEIQEEAIAKQKERFEEGAPVWQALRWAQEVWAPISAITREVWEELIEKPAEFLTETIKWWANKLVQLITWRSDEEMAEVQERIQKIQEWKLEEVTWDIEQARQDSALFDKTLTFLWDLWAAAEPVLNLLWWGQATRLVAKKLPTLTAKPKPELDAKQSAKIDAKVQAKIWPLFKQTTAWKKTVADIEKFNKQAADAVKSISNAKAELKFTRDLEEVIWDTPKTVRELAEAYSQTKISIWEEIDAWLKTAWKTWVQIDLKWANTFFDELLKEDQLLNKQFKWLKASEQELLRGKIEQATKEFWKTWIVDIDQWEAIKQRFNQEYQDFHQWRWGKRLDLFSDAIINKYLWRELDNIVNSLSWVEFQALKNQYWSLKATEKAIVNRAILADKANPAWLFDLSDVFTVWEILWWVVTMNPAAASKWLFWLAIKERLKFLNNPDKQVQAIFKELEKAWN